MGRWEETYELVDDLVESDYSWSAVGVFRRKSDGSLFWGQDGGCSCYGPWEDAELDLVPLDWNALDEFREAAMSIPNSYSSSDVTNHEWVAEMSKLVPR